MLKLIKIAKMLVYELSAASMTDGLNKSEVYVNSTYPIQNRQLFRQLLCEGLCVANGNSALRHEKFKVTLLFACESLIVFSFYRQGVCFIDGRRFVWC